MGDGGFWHNGLTSGVGNAVFNKSDNVTVIIDNGYSAATGGQDILSSRAKNANRVTALPIEAAVRGVGVKRVVVERFGIDSDTCTGDHSCIRLSGCPSLSIRENPDPLRKDPVASVQSSCVGCGLCGEVAHAAVLCPSFYRTELVSNPGRLERAYQRVSQIIIEMLQRRLAAREFVHVA